LRNLTRLAFAAGLAAIVTCGPAGAHAPSVAQLDAQARAAGNRIDLAERIGKTIFATQWSAEVSQISANSLAGHLIVGIRIWGVKFHRPMTREAFASEIAALAEKTFAAVPSTEEVDIWASVPIAVTKGEIVNGDLAKPTSRTVFSVSVLRGESSESVRARVRAGSEGVFYDSQWARSALKEDS
jgi:hypothetical protein